MKTILSALMLLLGVVGICQTQSTHSCTEMPLTHFTPKPTPTDLPRAASRAVSYKPQYGLYWTNGSTIKVKFIGGSAYLRNRVKYYANKWTKYANLKFEYVDYGRSDLRISFVENGSSWSVIGKQALYVNADEATMNFGWFNDRTPEYEFQRTILHEFGHALGLLHEHQNPTGGIPWNEQAVYNHYRNTQGWDAQTTYQNVILKASRNETQFSAYDPQSIMHYPVSSHLTDGRYQVGMNDDLSPTDISFIADVYGGRNWSESENEATDNGGNSSEIITETPPANEQFIVSISNKLGENQVSETVDLYLGNQKYEFKLNQNRRSEKTMRFRMTKGKYSYRLSSSSVYSYNQKVWNGWRYVWKQKKQTVYGSGSGTLDITGGGALTMYGEYDSATQQLRVYLGEAKQQGLANTNVSMITCREE